MKNFIKIKVLSRVSGITGTLLILLVILELLNLSYIPKVYSNYLNISLWLPLLTGLFLIIFWILTVKGFLLIFNQEKLIAVASFLLPAGIVLIYGLIVKLKLKRIDDSVPELVEGDLAEHHTESIYFMGFLFTLISLAESTIIIRKEIELLPIEDVADNIRTLGEETGELNTVIDSLLEVMEHKLERVG